MAIFDKARILVDWDNDGFACPNAILADPLNISDNPVFKHIIDGRSTYSTGTQTDLSNIEIFEDFGIVSLNVDTTNDTDHAYRGVNFGRDFAGPTIETGRGFPVNASTSYRLTLWIKPTTNSGDLYWEVHDQSDVRIDTDGGTILQSTIPLNTWTKITKAFTTGVGDTHAAFFLSNHPVNNPSNFPVFQIAGLMLTETSTVPKNFNAGSADNFYDNISNNTFSARMQLGYTSPQDFVFSEGTLDLVLDNTDLLYSPENTSSPLSGNLASNRRIFVQVKRPSTKKFETVWSGWISTIKPQHKKGNANIVEIYALQGKFNLDEAPLHITTTENAASDVVIREIFQSGYVSPIDRVTIVGRSRIGTNAFISNLATMLDLQPGDTTFAFVGEDWERGTTTPSQALEDIQTLERGNLWLNRKGRVVFRNRNYYTLNSTPALSLNVGTDLLDADYSFGDNIGNFVKINYHPKTVTENYLIWKTQEPIEVNGKETKSITAKLEEEYEQKITATSVNSFTATVSPSTYTALGKAGKDWTNVVDVSVEVVNGETKINIFNPRRKPVYVTMTLYGTVIKSVGGLSVEVKDGESASKYRLQSLPDVQAKMLNQEVQAQGLGEYLVAEYGEPFSLYNNLQIQYSPTDTSKLENILDMEVGTLIALTDARTGVSNKPFIVVGESIDITSKNIVFSAITKQAPQVDYWILNQSQLGVDTQLGY